MTTENNGSIVTGLESFKQKLKLVDYGLLIDKYFTTQNLFISGGIILFFIILMAMILIFRMKSDNIVEIEIPRLEIFEKRITELQEQQESLNGNLIELTEYIKALNKTDKKIITITDKKTSTDDLPNLLPDENKSTELSLINPGNAVSNPVGIDPKNEVNLDTIKKQPTSSMMVLFNSEMVDLDWKNKNEIKIIDTLEKTKFEKTWFENLECKSSICELVVTHINKSDSDNFMNAILVEMDGFTGKIHSEESLVGKFRISLLLQEKTSNVVKEDKKGKSTKILALNKKQPKKKRLNIEDKFKKENIDNRWRKLIEYKIKTILDQRQFQKTWFDQLLCKTSVCKLVITHDKKSTSRKFIKDFPLALGEFDKKKAKVRKNKNGNYKTTLYLQQRVEVTMKSKK
ncbi:MAG: hypothetical protein ACC653_10535 [Gammaproteobacteria bacterium]